MRVELSQDARKRRIPEVLYWRAERQLCRRTHHPDRARAYCCAAMLFALCDKTATVEVHHINAALAWVRYSVESVKFIFASAADR